MAVEPHAGDRLLAPFRSSHATGVALVLTSALAWSTAGFFTRLIHVDVWTMLVWRGVFGGLSIFPLALAERRGTPWRIRQTFAGPGLLVTLVSALGMIAFIGSLKATSVASVAVIYAVLPFVAALLARAWFGERISRQTMAASSLALVGVVVTVGGSRGGQIGGDVLAIAMVLSMALLTVTVRRHRTVPVMDAMLMSCFLASALCLPFSHPLSVSPSELAYLALFGFVSQGLGLSLFTLGAKRVPAAESTLLESLEIPLAPVWVWIAFDEVPMRATVVGGGLVAAAVLGQLTRRRVR
jgi:drug/metabolite transporter (DMT)-like permease